jgi:hypothetical protein
MLLLFQQLCSLTTHSMMYSISKAWKKCHVQVFFQFFNLYRAYTYIGSTLVSLCVFSSSMSLRAPGLFVERYSEYREPPREISWLRNVSRTAHRSFVDSKKQETALQVLLQDLRTSSATRNWPLITVTGRIRISPTFHWSTNLSICTPQRGT